MKRILVLFSLVLALSPASSFAASATACQDVRIDGTGSDPVTKEFVCTNAKTMATVYCNERGGTVVAGSWTVDEEGFIEGDDETADKYYCNGHLTCRICSGASAGEAQAK